MSHNSTSSLYVAKNMSSCSETLPAPDEKKNEYSLSVSRCPDGAINLLCIFQKIVLVG